MKKNKYGLSRRVPPEIKRQIRKDDGYGCILCGDIFVQYEHIDPLWCDAEIHDASKMALLCTSCHDKVTHKRIAKSIIAKAKKEPFCKRKGFAEGKFYPHPEDMKIQIGSSVFSNTDIAITISGKPLIWITRDIHDKACPLQYCGIFYDSSGRKIAYLNKNTFIGLIEECDFQAIENRIEVRVKQREINLILKIEGDKHLEIEKMNFKVHQTKFLLGKQKEIILNDNNKIFGLNAKNFFGGLNIGPIYFMKEQYKQSNISQAIIFLTSKVITNIFGKKVGYILNYNILDLTGNIVGYIQENKVYNLIHDYIGEISEVNNNINILMYSDEYDDQEPIWVSPKIRKIQMFLNKPSFDMTFRLFGLSAV